MREPNYRRDEQVTEGEMKKREMEKEKTEEEKTQDPVHPGAELSEKKGFKGFKGFKEGGKKQKPSRMACRCQPCGMLLFVLSLA